MRIMRILCRISQVSSWENPLRNVNFAAAALEEEEEFGRSVLNVFECLLPSFLYDFKEVPENGKKNKISQIQYLENIIHPNLN